jgi:hypothetical protein
MKSVFGGLACGAFLWFLQALLPNTDPKRRVVIGISNGAHMIGAAVCDGWKEFSDSFSAFVLHEGGASVNHDFNALRRKDVLVAMGEKSEHRDFAEWVVGKMEEARFKPEVFVASGEGHGLGDAAREGIRAWIAGLGAAK